MFPALEVPDDLLGDLALTGYVIRGVYVESEGLIYITDRIGGGLYILEYTGPRPTAAMETGGSLVREGLWLKSTI